VEVVSEYVIRGNTAVLKCNIPSFVADFVRVDAWVGSVESLYVQSLENIAASCFLYSFNVVFLGFAVVQQYYEAEVVSEYVIRGNTAVLKCNIPSFVADFVRVDAWVGSDESLYVPSTDYGKVVLLVGLLAHIPFYVITLFVFPVLAAGCVFMILILSGVFTLFG